MNKKRHLSLLLMICVILLFGCAGKEKEADPWEDENYFETRVKEQDEQEKERKAKEAVATASDGSYPMMWLSAFDRKSGTSFESADGKHITIENEDGSFDISCEFKSSLVYPRLIRQCTVTCPKDYDGTVFQLGYASMALRDENEKLDYSSQLYKVDELPYFDNGHTYRYFALGEKGTPSMGEKVVQDAIDAYNGDNEDKGLEWGEGSSPWNHLPESDEQED